MNMHIVCLLCTLTPTTTTTTTSVYVWLCVCVLLVAVTRYMYAHSVVPPFWPNGRLSICPSVHLFMWSFVCSLLWGRAFLPLFTIKLAYERDASTYSHTFAHTSHTQIHICMYVCIYVCSHSCVCSYVSSFWKFRQMFGWDPWCKTSKMRGFYFCMCICELIHAYMYVHTHIYPSVHVYLYIWKYFTSCEFRVRHILFRICESAASNWNGNWL